MSQLNEEWRKVKGYENYSVSTLGRVRNDRNGHLKSLTMAKTGYPVVSLNGKVITVHRLVATTFIDNPENKATVNHIDGDKSNNRADNLEWATYSENNTHAWRVLDSKKRRESLKRSNNPYFGNKHIVTDEARIKMSEAKKKKVICLETGKVYKCAEEASNDVSVGRQAIIHACNGRSNSAGGLHWKYYNDLHRTDISTEITS